MLYIQWDNIKKSFKSFFFVFIETLYIHAREGVFFLFESSRYDYRWNCNFILTLERKAHKKDNMNKFQFCKPIELDDVVRFMLLPTTKITVTQYSHFFSSQRFKHKSNLSQNDNFIFSFLLIFVLVFLFACVCLFVHRCPIWRPFGWILFTVWTPSTIDPDVVTILFVMDFNRIRKISWNHVCHSIHWWILLFDRVNGHTGIISICATHCVQCTKYKMILFF